MIGASLNQHRITASIGAGGIDKGFRARDTRLDRDVAIEVLPRDFVSTADRLRCFEQEAQTPTALNDPIRDPGAHRGGTQEWGLR